MMTNWSRVKGFTLIEIAIVLLVVSILLGYTVALFPVQQDLRKYREAGNEMNKIIEAIYAYAQVNGRLPCADNIAAPDGVSDPATGAADCTANIGWYGLIPGKTLGINGNYDANGSLLDPWGTPYRYQVSSMDRLGAPGGDFVNTNGIQLEGLANMGNVGLQELSICTVNPSILATDTICGLAPVTIATGIPAVVLSLGKDKGNVNSAIQVENTDNTPNGTGDIVFVKATRSDVSGSEFDDLIKWISPNILYSRMIEANRLP